MSRRPLSSSLDTYFMDSPFVSVILAFFILKKQESLRKTLSGNKIAEKIKNRRLASFNLLVLFGVI